MVKLLAALAVFAGLYVLWIVGRADLLRIVQGVRYVRAKVVRHDSGPDGFVPVFAFLLAGRTHEVRGPTAHASPAPAVGTSHLLSHPARRPDLARPRQTFARSLLYLGFAGWLVVFSDIWLGWLR